jgi:hypothetical protein
VVGLLLLVTWSVRYNGGTATSYIHLYYLPIVLAAFFFGDLGGVAAAIAAAFLSASLPFRVAEGERQPPGDILIRGVFFYLVALLVSRSSAKLQERAEEAGAVIAVSQVISASLRLGEVLKTIAEKACQLTAAKACLIRLLNPKTGELELAAGHGLSDKYLAKGPVLLEDSPDYQEALSGKIVTVLDCRIDPRFHYQEEAREEGLVSLIAVPFRRRGRALGVLRVYSGHRYSWSPRDRRLLRAFAEQATIAIENARLHESLRRNYWDTVSALARAMEAKDPFTVGHAERVTAYALQLGEALRLSADELETLRFAATLHDIGRIALPEAGQKVNGEVQFRLHPFIGMSILKPVEFLAPALDAVRFHHERWDGAGFPQGLKQEEIPLLARIVAVANNYDHLTTEQPGRSPLSPAAAALELRRQAGNALDPELVELFLKAAKLPRPDAVVEWKAGR